MLQLPYYRSEANGVVDIVTNTSGTIQQVKPLQGLINVAVSSDYEYCLQMFYETNVTSKSGGLYGTNGPAFVTWTIVNPDGNTSCNRLQVTESRSGLPDRPFLFVYTNDNGTAKWVLTNSINTVTAWHVQDQNDPTLTNYFWETRVGSTLLQKRELTYGYINGRIVLTQQVNGDGNLTKTTTYGYDSNGMLQRIDYPDGNWEYYQRDLQNRVTTKYSARGNFAPPAFGAAPNPESDGSCSVTAYYYDAYVPGDDENLNPAIARMELYSIPVNSEGSWSLQEVSRVYRSIPTDGEVDEWHCPNPQAAWDDSANLYSRTVNFADTDNDVLNGKPRMTIRPNGTVSMYNYQTNSAGVLTNIEVLSGQPDVVVSPLTTPSSIVNGTQVNTAVDAIGRVTSITTKAIINGNALVILSKNVYNYSGDSGRDFKIVDLSGRVTQYYYGCCGLDSTIDADDVTTVFGYDAMRRQTSRTVHRGGIFGITSVNTLDGLGRILDERRIGTDNSMIITRQFQYDLLGQTILTTNALYGVSKATNVVINGQLFVTNTYPDAGTRIDEYYRDGKLKSITGTGAHPAQYIYDVEQDSDNGIWRQFKKEIRTDPSGSGTEWTKSYYDGVGNVIKLIYSSANQPYSCSLSLYNNLGQLWKQVDPDGVSTLYQYDALGELTYTAIDMDQNSVIDFDGTDRITCTTNDIVTDHGKSVRRTQTYRWTDGEIDNTGTLVSCVERSTDGLDTWQIVVDDSNTWLTNHIVVSPGATRIEMAVAPDGCYRIDSYSYGQIISSSKFDSSGEKTGETTYMYDAYGRQQTVTDARNGSTSYGYNNADQVTTTTTPPPGNSQPALTTTTLYDKMLRPYCIILPDSTTVSTTYLLTGEIGLQSGSRTYPVAYGYDYAGRVLAMTNWSSFSSESPSGQRVTTLNYDPYRGWLTSKRYADGSGPTYAYTAAGRLSSRTWARLVGGQPLVTSYVYDAAGTTTNIVYSDGTPSVTNSYNRLGQLSSVVCNGMTNTLTYNLAGQLLQESFSGGPLAGLSVTNGYDQFLRRTNLAALQSNNPLLQQSFGYDAASRLQTVSDGHGDSATYSYLANSPLVWQIAFQQSTTMRMTTTKQYDYLNRLTSISSQPSGTGVPPVSFNYAYNLANQRTQDKLADGSYWVYQYDALGQVISGTKYFYDGTLVPGQQFYYSFDTIGNRTQTQAGGDQNGGSLRLANYSVNNLNQITNRDYPGTNDVIGVALATNSVTVNGQSAFHKWEYFRGTVGTNNTASAAWLTAAVGSGGSTNKGSLFIPQSPEHFSYDADGNLLSDGRWNYTWDAENRLVGMCVNTNVGPQYQLGFAYDAKGRRIQKNVTNGVSVSTINFLYDGWNLIATLSANSQLLSSYTWGSDLSGSMQGAGGVGGLLEVSYYGTSTTNCFPAFDGNGNVAALVNAADGTMSANYEYGPFGEVIRATGPMVKANPFRFSTKYQDDETDLFYFGYRYYKPSTGTWVTRDPLEETGGKNLYAFVRNDPVDKADAKGQSEIKMYYQDGVTKTIWSPTLANLRTALQDAINTGNHIDRIFIKGHGTPTEMWINGGGVCALIWGGEYLFVRSNNNTIQGSDNTDFTQLFQGALTPIALVALNGCETGRGNNSIAQGMSSILVNRVVVGGAGFRQWGCPCSARCVVGKKNYFINGVLQNSQW